MRWIVTQLLALTVRSARGTAAIALRLCGLLAAAPLVAVLYLDTLLHLLTFSPGERVREPALSQTELTSGCARAGRICSGTLKPSLQTSQKSLFGLATLKRNAGTCEACQRLSFLWSSHSFRNDALQADDHYAVGYGAFIATNAEQQWTDPLVKEALETSNVAARVAAACCLHQLATLCGACSGDVSGVSPAEQRSAGDALTTCVSAIIAAGFARKSDVSPETAGQSVSLALASARVMIFTQNFVYLPLTDQPQHGKLQYVPMQASWGPACGPPSCGKRRRSSCRRPGRCRAANHTTARCTARMRSILRHLCHILMSDCLRLQAG